MKQLFMLLFVVAGFTAFTSAQSLAVNNGTLPLKKTGTAEIGGTLNQTEMGKAQKISFEGKAVTSYTIGFLTANNTYFTKNITSDVFPGTLTDQLKGLPAGTKIYFSDIKYDAGQNRAIVGNSLIVLE